MKVSIIVPVYNVEKYLPQCLDSILAQTFKDFELLLIDDGSPDSSGAICDEYAQRDPRIRVFHKENGGPSAARNVGLDNAKGEWITFSDSDDWMESHWLEAMAENMNGTDMVVTGYIRHNNKKAGKIEQMEMEDGFYPRKSYSARCFQLMARAQMGYLWTMMFRNAIFQTYGVRFNPDMRIQEDLEMILRYLAHTNSFRTISAKNYHYHLEANKTYNLSFPGIFAIMEAMPQILEGEDLDKYRCSYTEGASLLLLQHCSRDNYYIVRKMFLSVPPIFHGKTARTVKKIVNLPYCIGFPVLRLVYYLRVSKIKTIGPSPGLNMLYW